MSLLEHEVNSSSERECFVRHYLGEDEQRQKLSLIFQTLELQYSPENNRFSLGGMNGTQQPEFEIFLRNQ
jgi:hypothetical protein